MNGTETYGKWSSPSVPIFLKFHFFNVTNPEEILLGKKAKVNEIGPFTYQEVVSREILGWDSRQEYLKFKTKKTYRFLPEKSIQTSLKLTTINLPLVVSFLS